MVLASPVYFTPSRFFNVKFQYLPHLGVPLEPRTSVRVHMGTSESPGHLVLPDIQPFLPGHGGVVQLQLRDPLVAAPGDFYVVRLLSPVRTLGGGCVVASDDRRLRRRNSGEWRTECERREQTSRSSGSSVATALERAGSVPVTLAQIAHASLLDENASRAEVDRMAADGVAVKVGSSRFMHASRVKETEESILRSLSLCHDREPMQFGFPRRTLFRELTLDHDAVETALSRLVDAGRVISGDKGFCLPARRPALTAKQQNVATHIETVFREKELTTPRREEVPALAGMPTPLVEPVVRHILESGALVEVSGDIILHRDILAESKTQLLAHLQKNGSIEPGALKDLWKTSRKYAIPLIEYWDRQGLTRRVGNARVLKTPQ
jgi:selenocysteine-specific elongation factor